MRDSVTHTVNSTLYSKSNLLTAMPSQDGKSHRMPRLHRPQRPLSANSIRFRNSLLGTVQCCTYSCQRTHVPSPQACKSASLRKKVIRVHGRAQREQRSPNPLPPADSTVLYPKSSTIENIPRAPPHPPHGSVPCYLPHPASGVQPFQSGIL